MAWQVKKLVDVCLLFADGDWIESKDQSSSGIRLIQTGNVGEGFFKNREDKARYISEETFVRLKCTEILPGDCLISRLPDPVGRSCIIPDTGFKMITAVDCTIMRFDKTQLDPDFFNYYSQSNSYLFSVNEETSGATRKRISRKKLGIIKLPVPGLDEQKRIVAILDETFEQIDQAKANAEQNLKNASELFDNFLDNIFSCSENTKVKTLGDTCSLYQGLAINKKTKHLLVEKSSLPLLRIKDLKNNSVEQYVSETGFPPKTKINKNDLIYTRTGSLGLVFRNREGILHNNSFKVEPSNELSKNYLFWWLQHKSFSNKIISLALRAAQPDITHKLFKEQLICFPCLDEQEKLYLTIEKIFVQSQLLKEKYRKKIQALEELKQSLLQKAFSGELTHSDNGDAA